MPIGMNVIKVKLKKRNGIAHILICINAAIAQREEDSTALAVVKQE